MANIEELQKIAESYLSTVLGKDADSLTALLGSDAIVEDPRCPGARGDEGVRRLVADFQGFFQPMFPRVERLRTTVAPGRVLCEETLHLSHEGQKWELPVGVVTSNDRTSGAVRVHVYYTSWPFRKRHSVRPALFSDQEPNRAEFKGSLLVYLQSLLTADLDKIRDAWEADIYFREASGVPYIHWGKNALVEYFKGLFANGAPMIRDDTVNEGGRTVFMEFTVFGWNGQPWKHSDQQGGLAVYERTSQDGLMRAIRIYDDVDFEPK